MQCEEMIRLLPEELRELLQKMELDLEGIREIRLRSGRPAVVVWRGEEHLSQCILSHRQLEEILSYLGNYSLYVYEDEIRQGFLTLTGGHRVGIAGKAVMEDGKIRTITEISSLNLRFAHQIPGCADEVIPFLWQDGRLQSTLIVSPPGKGKTTMLRDCIRQISNGTLIHPGMTVGLVDERSEIAGCSHGMPGNDVGLRTDVLDACPKAQGLMMLIRSMAPEVVAADEIGSREDLEALTFAMHCGCVLFATVHGSSFRELFGKPILSELVKAKLFSRYVFLKHGELPGKIDSIMDGEGTRIC